MSHVWLSKEATNALYFLPFHLLASAEQAVGTRGPMPAGWLLGAAHGTCLPAGTRVRIPILETIKHRKIFFLVSNSTGSDWHILPADTC